MSQIRLVLADSDLLFLEKLSAYIQKNNNRKFLLDLFSIPAKLEEWIEKEGKADLIVVSSSFYISMAKKPSTANIVILADCPQSLLPEGLNTINKYMPGDAILKEILSCCAESIPGSSNNGKEKGKISLILYSDGSDVLNPIAQSIAYIKAKEGKNVFYLSLDDISNTDMYFTGNNSKGLCEMLYYVKSKKDNLTLRAEACTSRDIRYGVEFMKGHKNTQDIEKMNQSECESLIQAIKNRSCYDEVIISRAFREDLLLPILLKKADNIYISALNYYTSLGRLEQTERILSDIQERDAMQITSTAALIISQVSKDQSAPPLGINTVKYACLPFPYEGGDYAFPPSNEYIYSLKSILEA